MICERCDAEFFIDWRKDTRRTPCRFCSKVCSNSREQTAHTINKIKRSLIDYFVEIGRQRPVCRQCGKFVRGKNKDSLLCRGCSPKKGTALSVRDHRLRKKRKLIEYKGGKCCICGYNKYDGALDFHHVDPEKKEFAIAQRLINISWEKVVKEIDKCILLCANCHREFHAGLIKIPEGLLV